MKMIKLAAYALMVNKPIRTLRLHATQGKLTAKKIDGQWFALVEQTTDRKEQGSINIKTTSSLKKKYKNVTDLGVYKELLDHIILLGKNENQEDVAVHSGLKEGLINIALGFYSFNQNEKIHFFKQARMDLVKVLTITHLTASDTQAVLEGSILLGLNGLIKKYEIAQLKLSNK